MAQKQQTSISKDQSAKTKNIEIAKKILNDANILEGIDNRIAAAKVSHVEKISSLLDTILVDYEMDPVVRHDIVNTFKTEYEKRILKS